MADAAETAFDGAVRLIKNDRDAAGKEKQATEDAAGCACRQHRPQPPLLAREGPDAGSSVEVLLAQRLQGCTQVACPVRYVDSST